MRILVLLALFACKGPTTPPALVEGDADTDADADADTDVDTDTDTDTDTTPAPVLEDLTLFGELCLAELDGRLVGATASSATISLAFDGAVVGSSSVVLGAGGRFIVPLDQLISAADDYPCVDEHSCAAGSWTVVGTSGGAATVETVVDPLLSGVVTAWYPDADSDHRGVEVASPRRTCAAPPGTADVLGDCDDTNALVYAGAPEICDGLDNDCDGNTDGVALVYVDADQDGFGDHDDPGSLLSVCHQSGTVSNAFDCDDGAADVNPNGSDTTCDGVDQDCSGLDLDVASATLWYEDRDGDGDGGLNGFAVLDCDRPHGFSATADDCDDDDPLVATSLPEVCDGVDNDCDGVADGTGVLAFGWAGQSAMAVDLSTLVDPTTVYQCADGSVTGTVSTDVALVNLAGPTVRVEGSVAVDVDASFETTDVRWSVGADAALTVRGDVELTNTDLVCDPALAPHAGAVVVDGGHLAFVSGGIDGCVSLDDGAAIRANDATLVFGGVASSVDLEDNSGAEGGAVHLTASTLTSRGTTWRDNDATGRGGALFIDAASTVDLVEDGFVGNEAALDGGGVFDDGQLVLTDVDLTSNESAGSGGGIHASMPVEVLGELFLQWNVAGVDGGGVWLGRTPLGDGDWIARFNHAERSGGGAHLILDAPLALVDADVGPNFAGSVPSINANVLGAPSTVAGQGGGIFVTGDVLTLTSSVLTGNVAQEGDGGGVYADAGLVLDGVTVSGGDASGHGAGVATVGLEVRGDVLFSENLAAGDGGGLWAMSVSGDVDASLTVERNHAGGDGGGLHVSGPLDIAVVAADNHADSAPFRAFDDLALRVVDDGLGDGGAAYVDALGTVDVQLDATANSAVNGGALAVIGVQGAVVQGSFTGNVASVAGGAVWQTDGHGAYGGVWVDNDAPQGAAVSSTGTTVCDAAAWTLDGSAGAVRADGVVRLDETTATNNLLPTSGGSVLTVVGASEVCVEGLVAAGNATPAFQHDGVAVTGPDVFCDASGCGLSVCSLVLADLPPVCD